MLILLVLNHSVLAICGTCGIQNIDPSMCCRTIDIHNFAWPKSIVNNNERQWAFHQDTNGNRFWLMECLNCIPSADLRSQLNNGQRTYIDALEGDAAGNADMGGSLEDCAQRLRNLRQKTVDKTRTVAGQYNIATNENTLTGDNDGAIDCLKHLIGKDIQIIPAKIYTTNGIVRL